MNENMFFYEHMGHMQFSILTLETYRALQNLAENKEGVFVLWEKASEEIQKAGFSKRQAEGELERFCYGFECLDQYDLNGVHEISLTHIGLRFLSNLLSESSCQSSQIAFLMRPARRNNFWNVIVQESTFFSPAIYEIIAKFKFRPGSARDFLRCISTEDLMNFLELVFGNLDKAQNERSQTLVECVDQVKLHGKYWASVGGRYSWFVFAQKFELYFSDEDWDYYDVLIRELIRPPEWGGGKDMFFGQLAQLLGGEDRLVRFRKAGIVRPVWSSKNIEKSQFRLTSPGYLMWERKKKGFIFEFRARKKSETDFELALCDSTDLPKNCISASAQVKKRGDFPSLAIVNSQQTVLGTIFRIINKQPTIF